MGVCKVNNDASFWRDAAGLGHGGAGNVVGVAALQLQGVHTVEYDEILE